MTRTIVSISDEDKAWLDHYSRRHHQSLAETVRQAVGHFRARMARSVEGSVLQETAGIWQHKQVDGLSYTDALRSEWGEAEAREREAPHRYGDRSVASRIRSDCAIPRMTRLRLDHTSCPRSSRRSCSRHGHTHLHGATRLSPRCAETPMSMGTWAQTLNGGRFTASLSRRIDSEWTPPNRRTDHSHGAR